MKLHSKELLYGLSEFYKIFGDQTRLRILDALLNKPLCVSEISELLDMTQPEYLLSWCLYQSDRNRAGTPH